ncbi:hypothetical protein GCM10007160_15180 [Litchfieldella qijiaojingensis]|uniref:Uncharacterized protein n=1 Tax=Litchfieldella qijiaojingensis TaxID=980347 RepID=A0ABQ2YLX3_9GAMM|nr:hypothetical protein GCM10007160_15180 [Halomonas qijiaojingensis]
MFTCNLPRQGDGCAPLEPVLRAKLVLEWQEANDRDLAESLLEAMHASQVSTIRLLTPIRPSGARWF